MRILTLTIIFTFIFCNHLLAQRIQLSGIWEFEMDKKEVGKSEKWFKKKLNESISLPGTMASNGKGEEIGINTKWTATIYDSSFFFRPSLAKYRTAENFKIPFWLTPSKYYVGKAWYKKKFSIPSNWKNKQIHLFFERVHTISDVWVDDQFIGSNNSLSTPHEWIIQALTPGEHTITVSIDNRIDKMNVGPDSHSVADHTQGNWNGIVGEMFLEIVPEVSIYSVQTFPNLQTNSVKVEIRVVNHSSKSQSTKIEIQAKSFNSKVKHTTEKLQEKIKLNPLDTLLLVMNLPMGKEPLLWDEFHPNLYQLTTKLKTKNTQDQKIETFGMRNFSTRGTQFYVNGKPVFLRGNLHNAEFPLLGHPDMTVEGWVKIWKTAKSYGLNHIRFHSWCPPKAAFDAADLVGMYLQAEAPTWPNHGTSLGDGKYIDQYIYDETERINHFYGNSPSFVMLATGNEPKGGKQVDYLTKFIAYWKKKDPRHVYTGASVAMSWPLVPSNEYMVKSGTRGFKDWIEKEPESVTNYRKAMEEFTVPYVTHELGQWCVYPDFSEISAYTGVYKAKNFELFQENLKDHGMENQAKDFLYASGKLQVLMYKAEIEKNLRTKGLGGFQLLGLQDFPGQGTALVGILNALWQPKSYVDSSEWSHFCQPIVPLAQFPKYVFTNDEKLAIKVELFHYGESDWKNEKLYWEIQNEKGNKIKTGEFTKQDYLRGSVTVAGEIQMELKEFNSPQALRFCVFTLDKSVYNDWDFWVYPNTIPSIENNKVFYTTNWDEKTESILENGGIVFLNACHKIMKGSEISMYFTPVFWNTSWFKMRPPHITGMLIQNESKAFENFPTDAAVNYQWWSIMNKSQVMHLEDFPEGFTPLVQPIDTWFMNRKLGLIWEANVGKGKLVMSSADLSENALHPASKQLYFSLINYMNSNEFDPKEKVDFEVIQDLLDSPSKEVWDSFTKESPDELKPQQITN